MTKWQRIGVTDDDGIILTLWECPVCKNVVHSGFAAPSVDCPFCRPRELGENNEPESP